MVEISVKAQPLSCSEDAAHSNTLALQQRVVTTAKLRGDNTSLSCYPETVYLAVGHDKQTASGREVGVLAKS